MNVAQRMKTLVQARGVTYTFISAKTGIPVDAISRAFLGKRKLPILFSTGPNEVPVYTYTS